MDIKQYISSGILELYVLGKLSSEEESQVREQMAAHPEIAEEVDRIELDLEAFDQMQAVEAPPGVLKDVLSKINSGTPPTAAGSTGSTVNWIAWGALALAAIVAGYFFLQSSTQSSELRQLNEELEQLRADCAEREATNDELTTQLAAIQSPGAKMIALGGSELSPNSTARVFLNALEGVTYLGGINLPAPPTGKQYQLWALVDGQPVDMGVFDVNPDSTTLLEVPYVVGAGAYAVTLEDAGGQPTPNLDQLYLIGNVG